MNLTEVIKRPVITEKVSSPANVGRYCFEVSLAANKAEIKKAVELTFRVKVKKIQTVIIKGKHHRLLKTRKEVRSADWKKATVQLTEGQKIDIFETGE